VSNKEAIMENIWCCGSCGDSFSKDEGIVTQDSETHFSFTCFGCRTICKNCYYIQSDPTLNCCQACSAPKESLTALKNLPPISYKKEFDPLFSW